MTRLWERLFGRGGGSAGQARERLSLVLVHDRVDLKPDVLDKMKDDLIAVISRYVEIDAAAVKIEMEHQGRQQRLIADIPLKASRKRPAGK